MTTTQQTPLVDGFTPLNTSARDAQIQARATTQPREVVLFPNTTPNNQLSAEFTPVSLGHGVDIRTLGFQKSVEALTQLRERQIAALSAIMAAKKSTSGQTVKIPIDIVVHILRLCFAWTVVNNRLAFWDSRKGIYNPDQKEITTVISMVEPALTQNASNDALFALTQAASRDIMLGTNDFQHKYDDLNRYVTFKNGIYDRNTDTMLPHTPENHVIRCVQINFTPGAPNVVKPDGWDVDSWLAEMAYDKETELLFLQMIRVAIQPRVMEKSIWFYASTGRNGKGTIVEIFYQLLGIDHIANVTVNNFNQRFVFNNLDQKLAIIGDDVPANSYIPDEGIFKKLHTGEAIEVEAKNKDPRPVRFSGLILQTTNELPRFRDKGGGLYRRILPVEFKQRFTEQNVNYNIKNKYLREEVVLSHLVARALALPDFEHYIEPERSLEALGTFKEKNDNTLGFMEWAGFDLEGKEYLADLTSTDEEVDKSKLLTPMLVIPKDVIWKTYLQYCSNTKKSYLDESTAMRSIEDQLAHAGWKKLQRVRCYDPAQIVRYFTSKGVLGSISNYHAMAQGAEKPAVEVYIRNVDAFGLTLGDYNPYTPKQMTTYSKKYHASNAQELHVIR